MNRRYSTTDFEKGVNLIRKYFPNAAITTDVIVGYPTETESDFELSLKFIVNGVLIDKYQCQKQLPDNNRVGKGLWDLLNLMLVEQDHTQWRVSSHVQK